MKIKHFTVVIITTIQLLAVLANAQNNRSTITAAEVVERIKKNVTCSWAQRTNDTFKAGDPDTQVTGIAVTFMATYDVLRRAKEAGCNFIITHEPTYYHGADDKGRLGPDAVIAAKDKFIDDNRLVIWRFHDHIHRTEPDGIVKGMVEFLGWQDYQRDDDPRLFVRDEITLAEFVDEFAEKFDGGSLRVIGNPEMKFTRFGLSVGASGTVGQMKMLQSDDVEVLVAGETCEWETVEYVRDASDAGMNKAMIIPGHANSEEAGMEYCGRWLRQFVTEVPIKFIPAGDPYWRPDSSKAGSNPTPAISEVRKIWDRAKHSAFTDLIRYKGKWYCTFRESDSHALGADGVIRIISSIDGDKWKSAGVLQEDGIDLRDPKLSITPDGRLMVLMGGSVYRDRKLKARQCRVVFSKDGVNWGDPEKIFLPNHWLWRVTWHEGMGYGVAYDITGKEEWALKLFSTKDGVKYDMITKLEIPGNPNETTLRFTDDGKMIALIRREGGSHNAWIGTSVAPYKKWKWNETAHAVGGPNFVILPDGEMWAAGRSYPGGAKTVLAKMTESEYLPVLTFPSGGDTSYPGMVWHDGVLWISYYSSHEGKTSIYLAKIK